MTMPEMTWKVSKGRKTPIQQQQQQHFLQFMQMLSKIDSYPFTLL